jgi:predicted RNase H-like HicB family nuclease
MVIEWSDDDQIFVVTVPDFRRLGTHGTTREDAGRMGEEAIATWLELDEQSGIETTMPCISALNDVFYEPAKNGL